MYFYSYSWNWFKCSVLGYSPQCYDPAGSCNHQLCECDRAFVACVNGATYNASYAPYNMDYSICPNLV